MQLSDRSASDDDFTDRALAVFDAEYRRIFPWGGDEGEHDEATHSAVDAVLAWQAEQIAEWLGGGYADDLRASLADQFKARFAAPTLPLPHAKQNARTRPVGEPVDRFALDAPSPTTERPRAANTAVADDHPKAK